LRTDLLRGCVGLVLTLGPVSVAYDSTAAVLIFGGLASLFAMFALRTGLRYLTLVEITDEEISWTLTGLRSLPVPWPRTIRISWRSIDKVALRFYSTKRDRSEGWMALSVSAGTQRIRLDSTFEGFRAIAARCARAAAQKNLRLSATTAENFRSLGIPITSESP
jgi:hypothetical protein